MTIWKVRTPELAFLFDGDSFCNRPFAPDNVPTLLAAEFSAPFVNVGINAITASGSKRSQRSRCNHYAKTGVVTIYHLAIGVNDLPFGFTGAQIYANKVEMADIARAAGFDFVVTHTTPPFSGITGPQETARDNLNADILADAEDAFDLVVDLTGNATMENPAGAYYDDGLHWSDAGALAYVAIAEPLVRALL